MVIQMIDFQDIPEHKANVLEVVAKLIAKYGEPSCGRNRATFIGKNFVFKVARNVHGEIDNWYEGRVKSEEYCKGRIIKMGEVSVLVQEKVKPYFECGLTYKQLPSWVDFIDCAQVGFDRKGVLKAYDFACN